ncbi:MAG: hypothetical protein FWE24_05845 [Defluviitaleaceae bacterium]|nr:hypothetical protein [Defluviitaleaceae bacterium]
MSGKKLLILLAAVSLIAASFFAPVRFLLLYIKNLCGVWDYRKGLDISVLTSGQNVPKLAKEFS